MYDPVFAAEALTQGSSQRDFPRQKFLLVSRSSIQSPPFMLRRRTRRNNITQSDIAWVPIVQDAQGIRTANRAFNSANITVSFHNPRLLIPPGLAPVKTSAQHGTDQGQIEGKTMDLNGKHALITGGGTGPGGPCHHNRASPRGAGQRRRRKHHRYGNGCARRR